MHTEADLCRQAASLFLGWPTNFIDTCKNVGPEIDSQEVLRDQLAGFIERHRALVRIQDQQYLKDVLVAAVRASETAEVCALLAMRYVDKGSATIANGSVTAPEYRAAKAYESHLKRLLAAVEDIRNFAQEQQPTSYPKMISDPDEFLAEQLKNIMVRVEANSFEYGTLWGQYSPVGRVSTNRVDIGNYFAPWSNKSTGRMFQVGTVCGKPVTIAISITKIGGKDVLFWESPSNVVDHDMIAVWMKRWVPNAKSFDANNFYHALCELKLNPT